jgi:hypothetical protein
MFRTALTRFSYVAAAAPSPALRAKIISRPWLATADRNPYVTNPRHLMLKDISKRTNQRTFQNVTRLAKSQWRDPAVRRRFEQLARENKKKSITIPSAVNGRQLFFAQVRRSIPNKGRTFGELAKEYQRQWAALPVSVKKQYVIKAQEQRNARDKLIRSLVQSYVARKMAARGAPKVISIPSTSSSGIKKIKIVKRKTSASSSSSKKPKVSIKKASKKTVSRPKKTTKKTVKRVNKSIKKAKK